jgi:D-alanyl-D-alanine carboxypeptidase (penicillin-binding protein 5/6)
MRVCAFLVASALGVGCGLAEIAYPVPKIFAKAALVVDSTDGTILYEKHADDKRAVASTQKLLTALIVSEAGGLDQKVKVESTDTRVEPSKVGLRTGGEYPRLLLLQSLLVKSGNDVARCLARDHSGGQDAFRPVLNAKARELGMGDSYFVNAHGLTEDGQESTARDMAKLAIVAHRDEHIREAVQIESLKFPKKGWTDTFTNSNKILPLSFVTGMKTGFTNAAGRCLVSSGEYDGRQVIAVVLGSNDKYVWQDSESLLRWALKVPADIGAPPEEAESDEDRAEAS